MALRRLAVFVGINIAVSIGVTLLVLNLWDAGRSPNRPIPTAVPTSIAASTPIGITPASTATPVGPRSYTVQPGDTPIRIALSFDVPLADLLAANNLQEGDLLSVGQTLVIPTGEPVATIAVSPSPTSTTPRPSTTSAASTGDTFVTIREIVSSGSLADEAVVLTNLSSKVDLTGWTLSDGEGHKYTFPNLTLLAGAEIHVHTTSGTDSATDLYWGQPAARWSGSGTIAYLRDPAGKLIATYRVP